MRFEPTIIPGAFHVQAVPHEDDRGLFARIYCPEEFSAAGIDFTPTQINISTNTHRFTLRGLHYQDAPYSEAKLVRAISGSAFDVIVDLRPASPAYRRWISTTLSEQTLNAIFIPEGCAHGFLTLEDSTSLLYQMGRPYVPGHARGYRYDDPAFGIGWPHGPGVLSDADAIWPKFVEQCRLARDA